MDEVRDAKIAQITGVFKVVVIVIVINNNFAFVKFQKIYLKITPTSIRFVCVALVMMLPFCF